MKAKLEHLEVGVEGIKERLDALQFKAGPASQAARLEETITYKCPECGAKFAEPKKDWLNKIHCPECDVELEGL
ncbi:MAG: hypothetical protein QXW18_06405 [Candidatus Bathyarchaeia archaeon]